MFFFLGGVLFGSLPSPWALSFIDGIVCFYKYVYIYIWVLIHINLYLHILLSIVIHPDTVYMKVRPGSINSLALTRQGHPQKARNYGNPTSKPEIRFHLVEGHFPLTGPYFMWGSLRRKLGLSWWKRNPLLTKQYCWWAQSSGYDFTPRRTSCCLSNSSLGRMSNRPSPNILLILRSTS